jgi:endonuclease/exonuclease/phosphatase family metal-dependent hydrolase
MPKSIFRRISKKFVIAANSLAAVAFLMGCYGKVFSAYKWWPVSILSLSVFYCLILLLLFLIFWLFIKPGWAFISIITIALAYKPVTRIIPLRLNADFSAEKKQGDIRLMTWNVAQFDVLYNKRSPETRDKMVDLINEYQPDIACFQEMVAGDTLINLNTAYYRKYSFYSVYEFASKLNMPNYFYTYDFRDDFLNHQHFGIMIFSKYPVIKKQTLSFYPYDYNSNFQYIDIVKDTDTIRVFNFHLQSMKFTQGNLSFIENPSIESKQDIEKSKSVVAKFKAAFMKRKIQADHIKAEIDKSPYTVIVCGDMNDVPNSYAYQTIGDNLQNAFEEKGAGLGRTFTGIAPTLRIDNIFMSKTFTVNQYSRVQKKLSDHFPVLADIVIEK